MDEPTTQQLCSLFELGELCSVESMGGTRNRNYSLHTENGRWFVRQRYAGYCTDGRIGFDHQAARYLADRGVPVHPARCGRDGQTWTVLQGDVWEVFPFIEGQPLRDGDARDALALGTALARWHQAGADFPLRCEKASARGEIDPHSMRALIARYAHELPEVRDALAAYRDTLEEAHQALPDERYFRLPFTLIHGDIQPANLLLREGQVQAFVDLDWCARQARLYDIASAILFCCAAHALPFDGSDIRSVTQPPRFEAEVIDAFLRAYAAAGSPLTPDEREALRPQMLLTWCQTRLGGARKVPHSEQAAFLQRPPDLTQDNWLPAM